MWLFLGLFGGAGAILTGFPILGIIGIAIGAICQYSQRKDEEMWEQVQDIPVVSTVYPILSVIAALIIAAFCFALLGLAVSLE